jgi:large subunit ribosomal protein L18
MNEQQLKNARRHRRTLSVRSRLRRFATAPRLSVHRSSKHIAAQVIDDKTGRTLAAATSTAKSLAPSLAGKNKTDRARVIGAEIARRAREAGVESVVFDRGPSRYHGRIKALAEAARAGGLKF